MDGGQVIDKVTQEAYRGFMSRAANRARRFNAGQRFLESEFGRNLRYGYRGAELIDNGEGEMHTLWAITCDLCDLREQYGIQTKNNTAITLGTLCYWRSLRSPVHFIRTVKQGYYH